MKSIIAGVMAVAFVVTLVISVQDAWSASSGTSGLTTRKIRILSGSKAKSAAERSRPTVQAKAGECAAHYEYLPPGTPGTQCLTAATDINPMVAEQYKTVDGTLPEHIYGGFTCRFKNDYPPASVCPAGTEIDRKHAAHYRCVSTGATILDEHKVCASGFVLTKATSDRDESFHCTVQSKLGFVPYLISGSGGLPPSEIDQQYEAGFEIMGSGSDTVDKQVCVFSGASQKATPPIKYNYCCFFLDEPKPAGGKLVPRMETR
jgi:hypothetical protein